MKLLIITRKVDARDERMGFFFDWLVEFARRVTKLVVICQEKGEAEGLPDNVEIYSLGKELGYSKLRQFFKMQSLVVSRLSSVDGVFSHMMPIYSILVGPWCRIYGKKLVQWYTHRSVDWRLRLAAFFVDEFVTASPASFRLKTKKPVKILGHGINIKRFAPETINSQQLKGNNNPPQPPLNLRGGAAARQFIILSVGRISPVKNIDLLVKAAEAMQLNEPELRGNILFQIVGGPALLSQASYFKDLEEEVWHKKLSGMVRFLGPVPPADVIKYYQACDLFVNLSETGSLDKAVLEAMACERLVLTSNEAFREILPAEFYLSKNSADAVVKKIKEIFLMAEADKIKWQKELRRVVMENHDLEKLIEKIVGLFKE